MNVFRLFLRDTRIAFILSAAIFAIAELLLGGVYLYSKHSYRSRIDFYQSFLVSEEENAVSDAQRSIASIIKPDSNQGELDRIKLLFSIWESRDESGIAQLFAESPETALLLVSPDKKVIVTLLREQNEKIAALRWHWKLGLVITYFSFAFLSALCLWLNFTFGWRRDFVYFPLRSWWFYCYLILFFPGALFLGILVCVTILVKRLADFFNRINLRRFLARWMQTHANVSPSYDEVCASIQKQLPETRRAWIDLFSVGRIKRIRGDLENKVTQLKSDMETTATRLNDLQTLYFKTKKHLDEFHVDEATQERVSNELDALIALSSIRGICMKNGRVEIYTDYLRDAFGKKVGPYRIEVNTTKALSGALPLLSLEGIYDAHETSNGGNSRGSGKFCFGNVDKLMGDHLADYRLCDAVLLMINSFQHG